MEKRKVFHVMDLKKAIGWVLGGAIAITPIAGAVAPAALASTPGQGSSVIIHSGRLAVTRYVSELERNTGQHLVDIDFTGDRSADVQILPDGLKPENRSNMDSIKDVFKNNGFDDVTYWAVL